MYFYLVIFSYILCFMSGDAMLFEAFCNAGSSWIAFFFFLNFLVFIFVYS